ncbi:SDR family oxidoreductase [Gordonia soli]|uniref:NAD-dependent epimerase/dehydratase domain-containing protein n=1 Tax=Gordonia soli NBRC 108243 TaxID=1223545 RepID=M0QGH5_9ACTN|nr:SDR family oxidoreductase [Gordonia soli]GAC66502.1 hypothetical protein GS4_02_02130 [Gordonia soli NBRC 108243]
MRVFVTGASGWIGSATVDDLLSAGHQVTGLARSDASAVALDAKGVEVLRGDLDDLDALARGAKESEAVVHLANKHDWADMSASNRAERYAVQTLSDALVGTDRPLVVASGLARLRPDGPGSESDPSPFVGVDSLRGGAENLALEYADRGVRVIAARFAPTVHGMGDHGFISYIVAAAKRHGVSAYVGDGSTAWSAVHRSDAAHLVRTAMENAPGGTRVHAAAESVGSREIAEAIGRSLDVPVTAVAPEDAVDHFGFIGAFFGLEMTGTSDQTRELLGWNPTGPTLLQDIADGAYAHS